MKTLKATVTSFDKRHFNTKYYVRQEGGGDVIMLSQHAQYSRAICGWLKLFCYMHTGTELREERNVVGQIYRLFNGLYTYDL